MGSSYNFDFHTAVIAWAPFFGIVNRSHAHTFGKTIGREHEIQLPSGCSRSLVSCVVSGNILACPEEFVGTPCRILFKPVAASHCVLEMASFTPG